MEEEEGLCKEPGSKFNNICTGSTAIAVFSIPRLMRSEEKVCRGHINIVDFH